VRGIRQSEADGILFEFGGVIPKARELAPWLPYLAFAVTAIFKNGNALVTKRCVNPVLVVLNGDERTGSSESLHLLTSEPVLDDPRRKKTLIVKWDYIGSFKVQVLETQVADLDQRIDRGLAALNGMNVIFLEFTFVRGDDKKWVLRRIARGGY
jgi:hypothetical protein